MDISAETITGDRSDSMGPSKRSVAVFGDPDLSALGTARHLAGLHR
jgi:hypothetical protein